MTIMENLCISITSLLVGLSVFLVVAFISQAKNKTVSHCAAMFLTFMALAGLSFFIWPITAMTYKKLFPKFEFTATNEMTQVELRVKPRRTELAI